MTYNVLSGALNTTVLYLICLHLVASYFSVLEASPSMAEMCSLLVVIVSMLSTSANT